MDEVKIVYRKLEELVEPSYNPRKISAKQKEDIKKIPAEIRFCTASRCQY